MLCNLEAEPCPVCKLYAPHSVPKENYSKPHTVYGSSTLNALDQLWRLGSFSVYSMKAQDNYKVQISKFVIDPWWKGGVHACLMDNYLRMLNTKKYLDYLFHVKYLDVQCEIQSVWIYNSCLMTLLVIIIKLSFTGKLSQGKIPVWEFSGGKSHSPFSWSLASFGTMNSLN